MNGKNDLINVLQTARVLCDQHNVKLTVKRLSVLEALLREQEPLSAYELADKVSHQTNRVIKPMSIYRILDFLSSQQLVHRLNMTNKYVACNRIRCCQNHGLSQFLLCGQCGQVQEVAVSDESIDSFMKPLINAGCILKNSHIELEVVCGQCQLNDNPMSNSHQAGSYKEENIYANSVC